MSKALIAGINQVATDKGLDREVIFEAIEAALISAYKRNYGSIANVTSEVDRTSGEMRVYAETEVVDEVLNERTEITLEDARELYPDANLTDVIRVLSKPANFGRIAAQTAKQVILQRIREAERDTVFENFAHRVGELINAQVRSTDNASGAVTVMLDEKHEALLMRDEQIPNERLRRGDYIRVYIVDVHKSTRGPVIKLSRTHRNLLRRLMEQEIPEVRDGTVEIKAIAREPGARSKAAVVATVPGVDPVGSCVGMRGLRIQNIVTELAGEKIDVVEWNPDVQGYIAHALSPAKVNSVILDDGGAIKTAIVVVPDRQLSLAIGKEGQNARLAAKLTGWRIDIKSESEAIKEGLDRLAAEQAQASRPTDLFEVVQRFLKEDGQPAAGEDLLSKAAKAVEEMDNPPVTEESPVVDFASLEELPEPVASEEAKDQWPIEEVLAEQTPDLTEAPEPAVEVEEQPDSQLTMIDELPKIITADMLRARKGKAHGINLDDIEIPAELLVGLEDTAKVNTTKVNTAKVDEDWLEEEGESKGKGKGKTKSKAKKSAKTETKVRARKRRTPANDSEKYDEYL